MGILDGIPIVGDIIKGVSSFFGTKDTNENNARIAQQNVDLQKQFAQNGIQWKVADAQAAGIHPLYALGASTSSFSPVSVGYQSPISGLGSAAADALQHAGTDISRSVDATRTSPQRAEARIGTAMAVAGGKLDLEEKALRLDTLRLQNQRLRQQLNPPMPVSGDTSRLEFPGAGGNTSLVDPNPQKVTTASAERPWQTGGVSADISWSRTPTGGWAPAPSKDVKEQIEDSPYEWSHFFRTMGSARPPFPAPQGQTWEWNWPLFEYRLMDSAEYDRRHRTSWDDLSRYYTKEGLPLRPAYRGTRYR